MHPLRFLLHFILNVASVALTAYLLPGVGFDGAASLILATIVLAFINALIRPIITILTLPINVLTLGLFGLVLNALFVLLAASLVNGFTVASFWWALAFSIVLSIISGILHLVEHKN